MANITYEYLKALVKDQEVYSVVGSIMQYLESENERMLKIEERVAFLEREGDKEK